jgi:hypothetical protein
VFDAIYCSHNLEHYYKHEGRRVLAGFLHVLKADGFAEIRVPDIKELMRRCVDQDLDVDDILYYAPAGPITPCDVIYGWAQEIERSGIDFFAHKTGFSSKSLQAALEQAGFASVYLAENKERVEISALAFKSEPSDWQRTTFGL